MEVKKQNLATPGGPAAAVAAAGSAAGSAASAAAGSLPSRLPDQLPDPLPPMNRAFGDFAKTREFARGLNPRTLFLKTRRKKEP